MGRGRFTGRTVDLYGGNARDISYFAHYTKNSLAILDEVGRGTSTYDGVSIAWSVLEYIHDNLKCRCLFATHYHELTSMSNFLPSLKNYTVAIEDLGKEILFLHNNYRRDG